MPQITDTYARAYDCCDSVLFEDGRFPTIDAIRERIQTNSPAVIKRAINDWTLHFVERHRQRIQHPNIPAALSDAAESLWQLALQQAEQGYAQQRDALAVKEAGWRAQIDALENHQASREREWQHDRERLTLDIRHQAEQIAELSEKLETATVGLEATQQALAETRQALSRADGGLVEARALHESRTREWTERFEQDHIWHLRRIEDEKLAARQHYEQTSNARTQALDALRQEHAALRSHLSQALGQLSEAMARQTKAEAESATLKNRLLDAERALNAERARADKAVSIIRRHRRSVEGAS